MNVNWADILEKLRSYPAGVHNIRPPCAEARIKNVEQQLGRLPNVLSEMVRHFNGAHLFDKGVGGELVALFGISEDPPLPSLEWGEDWYIDRFTAKWRAGGPSRNGDWAVAMMNYGDLIVFDAKETIKIWDTSQNDWNPGSLSLGQWIEEVLCEGDSYLEEE